jgi:4'-phosphopantetheinyl transferase
MRRLAAGLTSVKERHTSSSRVWEHRPHSLVIESDEVHVWRAALDLRPSQVQSLYRILTPDEQRTAERFYFLKDYWHYVAARGVLRTILAGYLGRPPDQLRFCYNPYGKPALAEESGGDRLRFNLSHSHVLALYAVARGREVGVDLEHIRPGVMRENIAERFFAPGEVARLLALPPNAQPAAFFQCWTRKEAYIKARGEGLSIPLDQFEVAFAPDEPAALLSALGDPREVSRWSVVALNPGSGYAAALVVEGPPGPVKCWEWPIELG